MSEEELSGPPTLRLADEVDKELSRRARRLAIHGFTPEELSGRARILLAESEGISSWRRTEIQALLRSDEPRGAPVTAEALALATELRDADFEDQHHKGRLLREQLRTLALLDLLVLLFLVALTVTTRAPVHEWPAWGYRTILGVLSFGALGATFSAARSIKGSSLQVRSPAQVSNEWVTLSRAVLGALPALAAYAFLQAKVLNLGDVDTSKAFAIAFIAGFSERLVLKVAETFAGEEKAR